MNKFDNYVGTSLGTVGFAVLDGRFAYLQRPDLWHGATEAGHDLMNPNARNRYRDWVGVRRFPAQLERAIAEQSARLAARPSREVA